MKWPKVIFRIAENNKYLVSVDGKIVSGDSIYTQYYEKDFF